MNFTQFRFGPFAPDQPDYGGAGSEEARNVLPLAEGYGALASCQSYSSGLAERVVGGVSVKDTSGTAVNYAGTLTALHELSAGAWVGRGTGYTATEFWDFAQFGNAVLAASLENNLQTIQIAGGGSFAQLVDFRAKTIATLRNFAVVGNTFDATDSDQPTRVRWSARGDEPDWTPSATTLAGFQNLDAPGGPIQRIVGREYGIIFQERAISRMTYTGETVGTTPVVWQFDEVERGIGTLAPRSVVEFAGMTAFFAEDGFRVFDGNRSQPIDDQVLSRTMLADLDTAYVDRVVGAVDVDSQTVFWAYPGAGNINGSPNTLVLWRYGINRWSFADENVDHLMQSATPFVDIDTDVGADDISAEAEGSLDDSVWAGGSFNLGLISTAGELCYLDGPPRAGVLTTAEVQPTPGRQSYVRSIRPIVDGGAVTIAIGHRRRQSEGVTWTTETVPSSDGAHRFRLESRYLRARVTTSGEFKDAVGVETEWRAGRGR